MTDHVRATFTVDSDPRGWLPPGAQAREFAILESLDQQPLGAITDNFEALADENILIHEHRCINLNPATNIMNPRAERLLASGLGTRPSLGYPGDKYETGLEAIEEIEVTTTALARSVFDAKFAEARVPSGATANLMAFMATCKPGDAIIAPPASIAGHVTHHQAGAAGLYGLTIHDAPINPGRYTIDVDGLRSLAREVHPSLITVGGSLNLVHHDVVGVRAVADEVGARVLFDAAHLCGLIAGGAWPNPLTQGADLMTMSTYKSLAGPPGGLIVTNDEALAQRIDAIAYPGLTANFDVAKTAALGVCLVDWLRDGARYANAMVTNSKVLADELDALGVLRFGSDLPVIAHQFAIDARPFGGGSDATHRLRRGNILASAIGLPTGAGDGLRVGTPEVTRVGMGPDEMASIARFVAQVLNGDTDDARAVASKVHEMRLKFRTVHFAR